MKILYHHRVASKDGQYVHIEEIVTSLRKLGHEVYVLEPKSVSEEQFGSDGGLVTWMKKHIPGFIYEILEFSYSIYDFFRLYRAYREFRPDGLYERYNLYFVSGVWLKKLTGIPFLLEVNAPLFQERSKYNSISQKSFAKWSENYVWLNADYVLPVTEVLAGYLKKDGVQNSRIEVIPNGVNQHRFANIPDKDEFKNQLGLQGKTVLGFTGFARKWHGLDRVVEYIASCEDINLHFLIVGDGPAIDDLKKSAQDMGVEDKLTVTGIVDRVNIAKYVSVYDIALQPDVVDYASPLKLFEYLELGIAVIAPDKDNICEILTDDESALLFDTEKDEAFIQNLKELCTDEGKRKKIAQGGQRLIVGKKLTWDCNAEKIVSLFLSIEMNS